MQLKPSQTIVNFLPEEGLDSVLFYNYWGSIYSEHLCLLSTLNEMKSLTSRSNRSIVEDIRQGEGKIYGAELLKDLLKLLPDIEEVCVYACLCGFNYE